MKLRQEPHRLALGLHLRHDMIHANGPGNIYRGNDFRYLALHMRPELGANLRNQIETECADKVLDRIERRVERLHWRKKLAETSNLRRAALVRLLRGKLQVAPRVFGAWRFAWRSFCGGGWRRQQSLVVNPEVGHGAQVIHRAFISSLRLRLSRWCSLAPVACCCFSNRASLEFIVFDVPSDIAESSPLSEDECSLGQWSGTQKGPVDRGPKLWASGCP